MKIICWIFGHKFTGPWGIIDRRRIITAMPGHDVILPYCWRCGVTNPHYKQDLENNKKDLPKGIRFGPINYIDLSNVKEFEDGSK